MIHVVKYTDSERGWGSEVWYRGFQSKSDAQVAIDDTMNENDFDSPVPDYYIIAEYVGEMNELPEGKKNYSNEDFI